MSRLVPVLLLLTVFSGLALALPHSIASEPVVPVRPHMQGHVLSATASAPTPIAGATLWATDANGNAMSKTRSDDSGAYRIDVAYGPITLHASAPGYADSAQKYSISSHETDADVLLSPTSPPPPPPEAKLAGQVTRSDTGAVIEGARLYAARQCDKGHACAAVVRTATSDASGWYVFYLSPGSYSVNVENEGFLSQNVNVEVRGGVRHDFALAPKDGASLHGRVVDAHTGRGLANAQIMLMLFPTGETRYASTDGDGAYSIAATPGAAQLRISFANIAYACAVPVATTPEPEYDAARPMPCTPPPARDDAQYYTFASTLDLRPGDNVFDAKLTPHATPTVVIAGYVVDSATNKAVPDAWVTLRNEDTGEWGRAMTDRDGSYRFTARPGWLVIEAGASAHFGGILTVEVRGPAALREDVFLPAGTPSRDRCDPCAIEATAAASSDASPSDAPQPASGTSSPPAASMPGSPAYAGAGGGLGPYRPGSANTQSLTQQAAVPGMGVVAGLAAVGAVALAGSRLRRR